MIDHRTVEGPSSEARAEKVSGMQSKPNSDIADGRYIGGNGLYWLELRVDLDPHVETTKLGAVSGDLQSAGPEQGAGYASFRSTAEGAAQAGLDYPTEIRWADGDGAEAHGTLSVEPSPLGRDSAVRVSLTLDSGLGGLPAGEVALVAQYVGPEVRDLGLQLAVEESVQRADSDCGTALPEGFDDRLVDSLRRAGFAVDLRPARPSIPGPGCRGWSEADIIASLQTELGRVGRGRLDRPAWDVHLLVLSKTDRRGLNGLMFDLDGPRPRQGAAVFVEEILADETDPALALRKVVKTAVHELGHALNLRHRFDPEIRRSGSPSYMNYDWYYRGGRNSERYWEDFGDGSFDPDEIAFLRHAARHQIVPGGAPFGSVTYWPSDAQSDGDGDPWSGLRLWLTPPPAGTTFAYGQPVFVQVSLLNTGTQPVWVPRHALDVKAGRLDVLIRQLDGGTQNGAAAERRPFAPVVHRCFDAAGAEGHHLRYGEAMHNNVNLSYGSGGSPHADPGVYELTPVLSFPAEDSTSLDSVVWGASLVIRVAPPQGAREKTDGDVLLHRSDVGMSLALGGSAAFQEATDTLEEIRLRRQRDAGAGPPDPVVPALTRLSGILHGRLGDSGTAVELLTEATTGEAGRALDPHTRENTRRLAARYRGDQSAVDPLMVVVDLWSQPKDGGPVSGGRGAGFLTTRGAPSGGRVDPGTRTAWGVLAPAGQLPAEAMDADHVVAGEVTLSSPDGVTERVTATRVDLVSTSEGAAPTLALLELSHTVPDPSPDDVAPVAGGQPGGDVAGFFGGGADAQIIQQAGADLNRWADAADQAVAHAPRPRNPLAPTPAAVHRYPGTSLDDVAGWGCKWIKWPCEPTPPPRDKETPYQLPVHGERLQEDAEGSKQPSSDDCGCSGSKTSKA
jgi:hypothetical protein